MLTKNTAKIEASQGLNQSRELQKNQKQTKKKLVLIKVKIDYAMRKLLYVNLQ